MVVKENPDRKKKKKKQVSKKQKVNFLILTWNNEHTVYQDDTE